MDMQSATPLVSIIIPSLNTVDYIDEALRSAVRQTLKDIEIICIDAGSTDGTYDVIQKYAQQDDRIRVFSSDVKSYGYQMNMGLDAAKGEYIGIIEPDDFASLDMYEDLYNIAVENDLDILKADFYRFFTNPLNGNMRLVYNHLSSFPEDYGVVFCPRDKHDSFFYIMNTWSGIYRNSFIRENRIRHNETPGASYQDNGFFFQTFTLAKRVMIHDRPYYMNRRDNPNSSMSDPGKVEAARIEYDFIRKQLEERGFWEELKTVHSVKRFDNYVATANRIAPYLKHDYLVKSSKELRKLAKSGDLIISEIPEDREEALLFLMNDPEGFYFKQYLVTQSTELAKQLESRIDDLEGSLSFRIGRVITWPIRMIRNVVLGDYSNA